MKILFIIMITLIMAPAGAFSEEEIGEKLYKDWCAQCHGYEGDGKGYAADGFTMPLPRDFTSGMYKFRTTPSGEAPLDEDIIRSIREGNHGTSMPPWTRFSDAEVQAIVEHIQGFNEETFEIEGEPFQIGTPPEATPELIAKGKEMFEKNKCFECHGKEGRGDGEKGWQDNFRDDWKNRVYPTNFTQPWDMRNGADVEDIFRSISTGLEGTPMASYSDAIAETDRWALSHFVKSLQLNRKLGAALSFKKSDTAAASPSDEAWKSADYIDLPLGGQLTFGERLFTPTITNMRIKGMYTDTEVHVLMEWSDKKPNKGEDGKPSDIVRMQIPVELSDGDAKPYFMQGDKKHPVNLWTWNAADNSAIEFNANGQRTDSVKKQGKNDIKGNASYEDGLYRVVLTRALDTGDKNDLSFTPGKFIPISFQVFDGEHDNRDMKASVSAWYYVMLEPPMPLKVYIMPPVMALAIIVIGTIIRKKLKAQA